MRREVGRDAPRPKSRSRLGLRGVVVKGGKTRDIPLPTVVAQYLEQCVD